MANLFSWEFDAPSGTYKNHELSSRLYEQAVAETKFMDFVTPQEGFGMGMGESVTLTRIKAIAEASDATLVEGQRIPEEEFELTTKSITVTEIGRALPYTSLANDLSAYDIVNPIQRKLMEQLRLTLDTSAAAAFKKTMLRYRPTGATAGNLKTDGAFNGTASAFLTYHCGVLRDHLFGTYFVTPWVDGDYVCLMNTRGLRSLKEDDEWEKWHIYVDPSNKFNSEVGRIENIRFMEVNHATALGVSNSVLGEGVIFGQDAVVLAEVQTPELRVAQPGDFGRARAVAWYGILTFDIIWETANAGEAKIIYIG